jgi:DNA-binding HxlR family transcriptional regulator
VLGRTYALENCSAARALEIVGERWSLLIIRDALFRGKTRFSEFERSLGVAPNILSSRLERFVAEGLMEKSPYSEGSELFGYVLTQKGRELGSVIIALTTWGDRWEAPQGPPVEFKHHECGGSVSIDVHCQKCVTSVALDTVDALQSQGGTASVL